jgi:hypothetical protein
VEPLNVEYVRLMELIVEAVIVEPTVIVFVVIVEPTRVE